MAREDLHFRLRIPEDLKAAIEAYADVNNRSMTAEIVARLADSIKEERRSKALEAENERLRIEVAHGRGMSESLKASLSVFVDHLAGQGGERKKILDEIMEEIRATPMPASKD